MPRDAGIDASSLSDASVEAASTPPDAAVDGSAEDPCPGRAGPTPVRIRSLREDRKFASFCVDSTEVTFGQYRAFVDAKAGDAGGQPPACAWNGSFASNAVGADDAPAGGIDWCDAVAYCAWAGKRLCGKVGGGVLEPVERQNADRNQLVLVCTGQGTQRLPYGNDFIDGRCIIGDAGPPGPAHASCEGAFPGVRDLVGNVWEWFDGCNAGTAPTDYCPFVGGANGKPSTYDCYTVLGTNRDYRAADVGFRCCSP